MRDDDVRAGWNDPPVPEVGPELSWWHQAEMAWLMKVVGPWRRRKLRKSPKDLPPPLSAEELARRFYSLPVSYWTYDFEPGVRHVGPMSQDFAGAFGLGSTNRKIHMVDTNGAATVAIQVLARRVAGLQKDVARLSAIVEQGAAVSASGQNGASTGATVGAHPGAGPGRREDTTMNDAHVPDEDDVTGHKLYAGSDRNIKHDVQPVVSEEEPDDVEAHRFSSSDRNVKHDVQPVVSEEELDDVEAHRFYNSDRSIKHDVQPVVTEDDGEDTEGHAKASRF